MGYNQGNEERINAREELCMKELNVLECVNCTFMHF